ncbi:MAG: TSUP family transporter, partial [Vampirovibrionia bacterium]
MFLFITGIIVGVFSGLLGIGGALLMFPILLYLPPLLGLPFITVHYITGITSMQTTFGTAAAAYFHHKSGSVNNTLVINIGIGISLGALIGSVLSKYLSGDLLIWTYVVVLFSAAILMLVRHADKGSENLDVTLNKFKRKLFLLGLIIGVPCGIL